MKLANVYKADIAISFTLPFDRTDFFKTYEKKTTQLLTSV